MAHLIALRIFRIQLTNALMDLRPVTRKNSKAF
ncbi:MAG: hypothetical protein ACI9S8_003291 [Chlamydiales bacterium]